MKKFKSKNLLKIIPCSNIKPVVQKTASIAKPLVKHLPITGTVIGASIGIMGNVALIPFISLPVLDIGIPAVIGGVIGKKIKDSVNKLAKDNYEPFDNIKGNINFELHSIQQQKIIRRQQQQEMKNKVGKDNKIAP